MAREHIEAPAGRRMAASLAAHWTDSSPEFERHFTNLVYRIRGSSGPWYLRITPVTHRSEQQILSELEVVRHLGACGVPCSQPVPARDGRLMHVGEMDGLPHIGCVFEAAPGVVFTDAAVPDQTAFFKSAGRLIGRVHAGLRSFDRSPEFARFTGDQDRWDGFADHVPRGETAAWALHDDLRAWLSEQPKDETHYGLVHGDFTVMNLRIEGQTITLFDFDACCDHWYAYEIATFLHYFGARPDRRELAYNNVLEGYAATSSVDDALRRQIPRFGQMRLLYSFLVFAEEWGFERLTPEREAYFELRRRLFQARPTWSEPGGTAEGRV